MRHRSVITLALFALCVLLSPEALPAQPFCEVTELTTFDGDTLVISARWADEAFASCGAVYVFHHHCGEWTQEAKLLPDFAQEGAGFGYSVAISGDTIVVGAPGDHGGANAGGAGLLTCCPLTLLLVTKRWSRTCRNRLAR